MKPTEDEIYKVIDQAIENNGKYLGMTYEDGVQAALEWVLNGGETPMEE